MPLFEYACPTCQHHFEELVLGSEAVHCPQCDDPNPVRKLSGFAVGGAGEMSAPPLPAPATLGPCGSCGHPDGPGSCDS